MMNDKEFRKNCKVLANDIVDFYSGWRKSLPEPEHWHSRVADTSELDTAALLYIAANMPCPDESNKKPCKYCDHSEPRISGKAPSHYIYIDSSKKELVDVCNGNKISKISRVGIKYCPFCRRKL